MSVIASAVTGVLIVGVLILTIFLGGCRFNPLNNITPDVYGPPEIEEFDPSGNMVPIIYGPPDWEDDYDPSANQIEDIYGPPEMLDPSLEEPEEEEEITEIPDEEEEFSASDNMEMLIYGPPEMFEDDNEGN